MNVCLGPLSLPPPRPLGSKMSICNSLFYPKQGNSPTRLQWPYLGGGLGGAGCNHSYSGGWGSKVEQGRKDQWLVTVLFCFLLSDHLQHSLYAYCPVWLNLLLGTEWPGEIVETIGRYPHVNLQPVDCSTRLWKPEASRLTAKCVSACSPCPTWRF